jgi:hypothetical protein
VGGFEEMKNKYRFVPNGRRTAKATKSVRNPDVDNPSVSGGGIDSVSASA